MLKEIEEHERLLNEYVFNIRLVRLVSPFNGETTSDWHCLGSENFLNKKLWKIKQHKNHLFVTKHTEISSHDV